MTFCLYALFSNMLLFVSIDLKHSLVDHSFFCTCQPKIIEYSIAAMMMCHLLYCHAIAFAFCIFRNGCCRYCGLAGCFLYTKAFALKDAQCCEYSTYFAVISFLLMPTPSQIHCQGRNTTTEFRKR